VPEGAKHTLEERASALWIVIENPLGSRSRFDFRPDQGWVEVRPRFRTPLPFEYGYIPATLNPADGEALDVLVVGHGPTFPGCCYRVRAIGLLLRADGDHKVVVVPHTADFISPLEDVSELDPALRGAIEAWFEPFFVLLGWRDARSAEEWIGACRTACSADREETG
jgi:inorganic pyrophosphatase